jgi:hypothetical protein
MTTTLKNYGPKEALNSAAYIRQNIAGLGLTLEDLALPVTAVIALPNGAGATGTFARISKRYIVPFNGKFYSYPLMLVDHPTSPDLYKMQAPLPNILREGMVVVNSEVFFVKLEDLKRGIVRKSRKLPIPPKRTITYKDFLDGLACTPATDLPDDHFYSSASVAKRRADLDTRDRANPSTTNSGEAGSSDNQLAPRVEGPVDLDEELRLIDMAYSEQIGSLLGDPYSEEEWTSPRNTQS